MSDDSDTTDLSALRIEEARLQAERRALRQKLEELGIEAMHVQWRIFAIERTGTGYRPAEDIARDLAQTTDHLGRDAKDFAIEFGGYLANAADAYQGVVQEYLRGADGADELMSERWRKLDSAVFEFRKRAERARA